MYNSLGKPHGIADDQQLYLNRQDQEIMANNQRLRYLEQRDYDVKRKEQFTAEDGLKRAMYTDMPLAVDGGRSTNLSQLSWMEQKMIHLRAQAERDNNLEVLGPHDKRGVSLESFKGPFDDKYQNVSNVDDSGNYFSDGVRQSPKQHNNVYDHRSMSGRHAEHGRIMDERSNYLPSDVFHTSSGKLGGDDTRFRLGGSSANEPYYSSDHPVRGSSPMQSTWRSNEPSVKLSAVPPMKFTASGPALFNPIDPDWDSRPMPSIQPVASVQPVSTVVSPLWSTHARALPAASGPPLRNNNHLSHYSDDASVVTRHQPPPLSAAIVLPNNFHSTTVAGSNGPSFSSNSVKNKSIENSANSNSLVPDFVPNQSRSYGQNRSDFYDSQAGLEFETQKSQQSQQSSNRFSPTQNQPLNNRFTPSPPQRNDSLLNALQPPIASQPRLPAPLFASKNVIASTYLRKPGSANPEAANQPMKVFASQRSQMPPSPTAFVRPMIPSRDGQENNVLTARNERGELSNALRVNDVNTSYNKDDNASSQRYGSLDNMSNVQNSNNRVEGEMQLVSSRPGTVVSQTNQIGLVSSSQGKYRVPTVNVTQALSDWPIAVTSQSSNMQTRGHQDGRPTQQDANMFLSTGWEVAIGRPRTSSVGMQNTRLSFTTPAEYNSLNSTNDAISTSSNYFPYRVRQSQGSTFNTNSSNGVNGLRKMDSLTSGDRVDGVRGIHSHAMDQDGSRNWSNVPRPLRKRASFDIHDNHSLKTQGDTTRMQSTKNEVDSNIENVKQDAFVPSNLEKKNRPLNIGVPQPIINKNLGPPAEEDAQAIKQQSVGSRETVFGLFSVPIKAQGSSTDPSKDARRKQSPTIPEVNPSSQGPLIKPPFSILDRLLASPELQVEGNKSPTKSTVGKQRMSSSSANDDGFPSLSQINFQTLPEPSDAGGHNHDGLRGLTISPLNVEEGEVEEEEHTPREGEPESSPSPIVEVVFNGLSTSPDARAVHGILRSVGLATASLKEGERRRRVKFDPLTLLLDAALEGELSLLKEAIKEMDDPSRPNDEGITALHNAICAGHLDCVQYLVEHGCDVNAPDNDGWRPLHCAASCNNLSMARFLVENGACVFATTTSDDETAAQKCEPEEIGYAGCFKYLSDIQEKLGVVNNGIVFAAYDYDAMNADELSFRSGDKFAVLRRDSETEKEWWWARFGSVEGFVPRNLFAISARRLPHKDVRLTHHNIQ